MFSTTTIASSTTRPMPSTNASSVSRLIEKPSASSAIITPISDSGMVTIGMIVERMLPMNRKMTTMTIAAAAISVLATSRIDERMNSVES